MPDLTFVLPHWLYWAGIVLFPVAAMVLVRRQRGLQIRVAVSMPLAYMLWLTGGFVGLHRFYLRSWVGVLYLPLFVGILYLNADGRNAREMRSLADGDVMIAEFDLERAQKALSEGDEDALSRSEAADAALEIARAQLVTSDKSMGRAADMARYLAFAILTLLIIDAIALPRLIRRQNMREAIPPISPQRETQENPVQGTHTVRTVFTTTTDAIDALSRFSGEYVAYWSVIAVFVYYYEVVARYVFNSPTNWAHEAMFLMFGMQYLICGAFAYLTDSHVRVDVFYARLSHRGKAVTDLLTSVFFFIFAGTILGTGYIFFYDSIGVWEVSFTEWAIQYWPVKATVILGAVLIILQGAAKVIKDFHTVLRGHVV